MDKNVVIEVDDTNVTLIYFKLGDVPAKPYYEVWTDYVEDPRFIGRIVHKLDGSWVGKLRFVDDFVTKDKYMSMIVAMTWLEKERK